ncbi:Monogalactosyldiacylglycerol synthase 1, chloroplastic [Asimina triloba]
MQPSAVAQETKTPLDLFAKLGCFDFDYRCPWKTSSNGLSPLRLSSPCIDQFELQILQKKRPRAVASLQVGGSAPRIRSFFSEFNRFVKFHSEKIPIGFGFASVGVQAGESQTGEYHNDILEDDALNVNGVQTEDPKKVLILMSDTGGGHRASAEAIKAAFNEEFGDEYRVSPMALLCNSPPCLFSSVQCKAALFLSLVC